MKHRYSILSFRIEQRKAILNRIFAFQTRKTSQWRARFIRQILKNVKKPKGP